MNTHKELLQGYLVGYFKDNAHLLVDGLDLDLPKVVESRAVRALDEICTAVREHAAFTEESDFELVEEMIRILDNYGLDSGNCHDFG